MHLFLKMYNILIMNIITIEKLSHICTKKCFKSIQNSKKLDITQMSVDRRMDKQIMAYSQTEVLYSHKK